MNITVPTAKLVAVTGATSRVVTPTGVIHLSAGNGTLAVTADNNELRIEQRTETETHVDGAASAYIMSGLFREVVKAMPGETTDITFGPASIEIHSDGLRSSLRTIDSDTAAFPLAPTARGRDLELDMGVFAAAVGRVIAAVSNDPVRPALTAVSMRSHAGSMTVAATDSYRLHIAESSVWHEHAYTMPEVLVPGTAMQAALGVFAGEQVTLSTAGGVAVFAGAAATVWARLVDAKFPDYQRVIPDPAKAAVHVRADATAVLDALTRTDPVSKHAGGYIRIDLVPEDGVMVVESTSGLGDTSAVVHAAVSGEGFTFGVSSKLFAAAVKSAKSEQIDLWFTSEWEPVLVGAFGDPTFRGVVMPARFPATS